MQRKKKGSKVVSSRSGNVRPEAQPDVPTYRRNRTMTDRSALPEISERARIHQLRLLRRKIGIGILIVSICALLGAIGISQYSGSVRIVNRDTSLARSIDEESYRTLLSAYYRHHPIERFRFVTNYERLSAALQQEAPEIDAVRPAGTAGLAVSRYELVMRRPVASWTVGDKRYYVDAKGATFTRNYYDEPKVSVTDNSGASVAEGAAIASSRLLSFVGRVVALSSDQGVVIDSIEIPTQSMRQLSLKGKGMPAVRMVVDREVDVQVNDMVAALRHLKAVKAAPAYIDVRVEGKAFYK